MKEYCSGCGSATQNSNLPQPLPPKKTVGKGLGITSMILGIIGSVNSLPCFLYLMQMFTNGYERNGAIAVVAVTLAFALPSFIFGSVSALKGRTDGQTTAGLILSSISLIVALSVTAILIIDVNTLRSA